MQSHVARNLCGLREVDVELIERRPADLAVAEVHIRAGVVRLDDEVRLGAAGGDRVAEHRDDAGVALLRDAVPDGANHRRAEVDVVERRILPVDDVLRQAPRTPAVEQPHPGDFPAGDESVDNGARRREELLLAAERKSVDAGDRDAVTPVGLEW